MKILIILRHAKSSWSNSGLSDFDRPLNERGKRDAPFMGKLLRDMNIQPDAIFVSPAKRAKQTIKKVVKELGIPESEITWKENAYLASTRELLRIIHSAPKDAQSLMLVGHNPGLTDLANQLGNARIDNIPTAGVCYIDFEVDDWKGIGEAAGKVRFFEYPKK